MSTEVRLAPLVMLSAGHGNRDPGAVNADLSLSEHVEAYKITWMLRDQLERRGVKTEFISCFQTLTRKIAVVNYRCEDAIKPAAAIEIHFNSAAVDTAHGTEVLHYGASTKELAARISRKIAVAIGTRDRGPKVRPDLGWLKLTKCPAVIVEVSFINNPTEAAKILEPGFHGKVAAAITKALT